MDQLHSKVHPVVLLLLAIFLPPVAVYFGSRDWLQVIINVILCLCFVIPGVVHALYFALRRK